MLRWLFFPTVVAIVLVAYLQLVFDTYPARTTGVVDHSAGICRGFLITELTGS